MTDKKFPTPQELQKDFEDFLKKQYGKNFPMYVHSTQTEEDPVDKESSGPNWDFRSKPKDIKAYLDRFVVGQEDAKKALAIAVCDHYNRIEQCQKGQVDATQVFSKQNVLMLGPTGVGKTYLVRLIAKLIGVPFVKADATRFSETGYVGANVDDLIRDLVQQADGDIEKAQFGIIYLDEADKLASSGVKGGRDVSGRGVQFGLLKLMEESDVDIRSGNDPMAQIQAFAEMQRKGKLESQVVNTKHILFIVSGAFHGLEDIIKERMQAKAIGFARGEMTTQEEINLFHLLTTEDLVHFGLEPEFVGRLPVRVGCTELSADLLERVLLESEESILNQFISAFAAYGIDMKVDPNACRAIAEKAATEKTGARALSTVLERVLRDFKFELPSSQIKSFVLTPEVIETSGPELEKMLKDPNYALEQYYVFRVPQFEKEYSDRYDMRLQFTTEAREFAAHQAINLNLPIEDYLTQTLKSYEYGLNLIRQNTGRKEFIIDQEVLSQPEENLEAWIKESYSHVGKEMDKN